MFFFPPASAFYQWNRSFLLGDKMLSAYKRGSLIKNRRGPGCVCKGLVSAAHWFCSFGCSMLLRASAAASVSSCYLRQVEMPRRQTDGDVGGRGISSCNRLHTSWLLNMCRKLRGDVSAVVLLLLLLLVLLVPLLFSLLSIVQRQIGNVVIRPWLVV